VVASPSLFALFDGYAYHGPHGAGEGDHLECEDDVRLGVEVDRVVAAFDASFDVSRDGREPWAYGPSQETLGLFGAVEPFADEHTGEVGIGAEEALELAEDGVEAVFAGTGGQEEPWQGVAPVFEEGFQHARTDVFLRGKVMKDGGLGHADGVGDVLQGGPFEATRGEESRGGSDHLRTDSLSFASTGACHR